MQKKNTALISTNDLESVTIEFIGNEMAFNAVHYKGVDDREEQIQRHKHVEDTTNVTKINSRNGG